MYAQFLIDMSIAKPAYNNRESTIFDYNSITLSASYGHVTFIASRSCKSSRSWYIPPAISCNGCYSPPLDHMLTGTLVLGDFNAHHSLWHSETTDTRGNQLADSISISIFAFLNTDSPTRLPGNVNPSSQDVSLASASHLV